MISGVTLCSLKVTPGSFHVITALCPGGYELVKQPRGGFQCECLEQVVDNIVHCEGDQDSVVIKVMYKSFLAM